VSQGHWVLGRVADVMLEIGGGGGESTILEQPLSPISLHSLFREKEAVRKI